MWEVLTKKVNLHRNTALAEKRFLKKYVLSLFSYKVQGWGASLSLTLKTECTGEGCIASLPSVPRLLSVSQQEMEENI